MNIQMKSKRHINIPIFIPHLGCPNNCVFCNQRSISGKTEFVKENVVKEIEEALATMPPDADAEIAFFGGSFTGIDRELMVYLLDIAQEYIDRGYVRSIRMSTRPDYISDEILSVLANYKVGTIELGLQSMDNAVLEASKRGHDRDTALKACKMVKDAGYELIGQMMIGLPLSTPRTEIETAELICSVGADGARVYPTVVFYGTELCDMAKCGIYTPLTDDVAAERTKEVLKIFDRNGVPCIRVGLCASENLSDANEVYGGANHSAVGEMAMSLLFREKIEDKLAYQDIFENSTLTIFVPVGCTSKAVGQKKANKLYLREKYGFKEIKIKESARLCGYETEINIV